MTTFTFRGDKSNISPSYVLYYQVDAYTGCPKEKYPNVKYCPAQSDAFSTYFTGYNLNATLLIEVWTYVG